MAAFPTLAGVETLTLLVDHDENGAGQRAAEQCASRWADAGKEVIRLRPGNVGDFNDLERA
jgi:putative DNA primase/helicase